MYVPGMCVIRLLKAVAFAVRFESVLCFERLFSVSLSNIDSV